MAKRAELFLCSVILLTVCQYAQSYYTDIPLDNPDYVSDYAKISGGQFAQPAQFPYIAAVHRIVGPGIAGQCGGTIISSRWVLTAGHCVDGHPQRFVVMFGITDKSNVGQGVSMIPSKVIIHQHYAQSINDIALLYMPRDIPFSNSIQPIQLARTPDSFTSRTGVVIGWGKEERFGDASKRLKYTSLPIINNNRCRQYWPINNDHICTEGGVGEDACEGDSGGPLVVVENGQDIQVGIVSYGDAFCPSGRPGVYTRVSSYIQWMNSVIRNYK